MPKISVIVPVYNCEKYIDKCARSLFEQTLDDIEYIFVNDCSPDNSMLILENIIKEYPYRTNSIKILNHTINTGQSGARRDGMAIATGDYIIHCDSDDWVDLTMYEEMYNIAISKGVDAVCCDMVLEYGNSSEHLQYNSEYDDHQLMYDCIVPISVVYMSMCNRLVSRKIFEQYDIKPFGDINMWDDVGLVVRIRFYIKSSFVINKAYYHYNKLNIASTTNRPIQERIVEQTLCVSFIEKFFIKENSAYKFRYFISYLKYKSKEELFLCNPKLWLSTFPESKKHIFKIRRHLGVRTFIKYILFDYLGCWGYYIWKLFSLFIKSN